MKLEQKLLSDVQREQFQREGIVVIPGFYHVTDCIRPILMAAHEIIGQVMRRHGVPNQRACFDLDNFSEGYSELIARDRAYGGEVYDAVKQVPAFIRLVADPRHERIFRLLRPDSVPAIAAGGYGIRIDNPGEDRFRAEWHQEYPSQLRSPDGLVFWSPLVQMTEALGPVQFCPGSQQLGPLPVLTRAPRGCGKTGAYALRLKNEAELIGGYPQIAPLLRLGDLAIVDFMTLHASGYNRSESARWSMQFRYFNFNNPIGRSHGWPGSFAAGVDFRLIHPELCAD